MLALAALGAIGCGSASPSPTSEASVGASLKRHRTAMPVAQRGTPGEIALLCQHASAALDRSEDHAPAVMGTLLDELGRLRVAARWKRRIDRYRSALRRELPMEQTVAAVAPSEEEFPLVQLVEARESKLRAAGAQLGVSECAASPL
jgi:hypothetical protein